MSGAHQRGQRAASPSGSCSSATSTTPPTTCARRSPARSRACRRELLPPVITKVDPDADPVMSLDRVVRRDEPADADRDRRQADHARRSRRSTASARSRIGGGRAREIHIVVDIEKLNSYGLSIDAGARRGRRRERRDSRRHGRAGQGAAAAAHARPHRRHRGLQQHRRRDARTARRSASSDIGYAEDSFERPTTGGLARRHAGGACSTSGARWARTPSR